MCECTARSNPQLIRKERQLFETAVIRLGFSLRFFVAVFRYQKKINQNYIRREDMKLPKQTLEFRYDTQLLIEGEDLDEDEISEYITEHFKGDSLIAAGDEDLIKIHFHTNEPWEILKYGRSLGEIFDIVVEDMDRQTRGLKG